MFGVTNPLQQQRPTLQTGGARSLETLMQSIAQRLQMQGRGGYGGYSQPPIQQQQNGQQQNGGLNPSQIQNLMSMMGSKSGAIGSLYSSGSGLSTTASAPVAMGANGSIGSLYGAGHGLSSGAAPVATGSNGAIGSLYGAGSGLSGGAAAGGSATGAGAAGGGGGSSLAGAGPWGALAALIYVNEKNARDGGYRSSGPDYVRDLLDTKVVEQDAHKRWSKLPDKWLGDESDSMGIGAGMKAFSNLTTGDFRNGFKDLDDMIGAKTVRKIGKIFGIS